MGLKDVTKGGTVGARDLRRLAGAMDAARQAASFSASASTVVTPGGVGTAESGDDWFPARVASVVTSSTYTFVEQWLDTSGAVADKPSGRTNTSSDVAVVFGSATYSVGDKILVKRSRGAGGFRWEIAPAPAASGGGTVTSIVTKESDGTPSYTFTATVSMEYDQSTGFKLSQPAAGRVKIEMLPASATQTGVVTTAAQTFAGDKTFSGSVLVGVDVGVTGNITGGGVLDNTGAALFRSSATVFGGATCMDDGSANGVKGSAFKAFDGYGNGAGSSGGFYVASNITSYTTTADRYAHYWGGASGNSQPGEIGVNGVIRFASLADSTAPNNALYYSSTQSKLVYKDGGGTVNALY